MPLDVARRLDDSATFESSVQAGNEVPWTTVMADHDDRSRLLEHYPLIAWSVSKCFERFGLLGRPVCHGACIIRAMRIYVKVEVDILDWQYKGYSYRIPNISGFDDVVDDVEGILDNKGISPLVFY